MHGIAIRERCLVLVAGRGSVGSLAAGFLADNGPSLQSEMFQDDIFPPCEAPIPALTADEWAAGENRPPRLLKFTEEGLETMAGVSSHLMSTHRLH